MTWLTAILRALFDSLLAFFAGEASKPKPMNDANTPIDIRTRWDKYIADKLRGKKGGGDQQSDGRGPTGQGS